MKTHFIAHVRLCMHENVRVLMCVCGFLRQNVCVCVWAEVNLAQQWRALDKEQPDPCLITFRLHFIGVRWAIGVSVCVWWMWDLSQSRDAHETRRLQWLYEPVLVWHLSTRVSTNWSATWGLTCHSYFFHCFSYSRRISLTPLWEGWVGDFNQNKSQIRKTCFLFAEFMLISY